ncbi:Cacna1h [Symbiodinium pilosum]|uniref:Cacna1h protein n=1 Tax=Symbiodinium pilosum TaxID=2952 RepID=A0A812XVY4_SYMPI|nr:Cacna1h [Symbiodinium pilosum]
MRRWWYGEEPVLETDTKMEALGKRARRFLESATFGKILATLIFLNCCSLGWQVDWGVQNYSLQEPVHFEVLGALFTLVFLAEFGFRVFAYGWTMYFCQNPDIGWNAFDGLLVLSSIVDEIMSRAASGINVTALRVLRLARLLRILRVFRVVRYFTDLRVMVQGILISSKTLVWALALLFLLMFAVAACILQLLRPYLSSLDPATETQELLLHFGSMPGGIFTLFSSMSGGVDWADVARKLNDVSTLLALLFVVYMAFALFCVLNVMTGVFVENASRMTAADEEMCMMEELRARKEYVDTVSRLFAECDKDNSGNVNWEEFQECAADLHFQTCFKKLGIAIDTEADLRNVFHMLDFQNNGSVSVEEFAIGIQMFSGGAKSIDVARLMFEMNTMKKYMANVHEALVGPVDEDDYPEFPGAQMRPSQVSEESLPAEDIGEEMQKSTEDGGGMQGVVPVHAPMKAWLD